MTVPTSCVTQTPMGYDLLRGLTAGGGGHVPLPDLPPQSILIPQSSQIKSQIKPVRIWMSPLLLHVCLLSPEEAKSNHFPERAKDHIKPSLHESTLQDRANRNQGSIGWETRSLSYAHISPPLSVSLEWAWPGLLPFHVSPPPPLSAPRGNKDGFCWLS